MESNKQDHSGEGIFTTYNKSTGNHYQVLQPELFSVQPEYYSHAFIAFLLNPRLLRLARRIFRYFLLMLSSLQGFQSKPISCANRLCKFWFTQQELKVAELAEQP